jgi:hypothetical protein
LVVAGAYAGKPQWTGVEQNDAGHLVHPLKQGTVGAVGVQVAHRLTPQVIIVIDPALGLDRVEGPDGSLGPSPALLG